MPRECAGDGSAGEAVRSHLWLYVRLCAALATLGKLLIPGIYGNH